ncbi:bifunctional 4-hydroxy-2-oxoglutarate aldolase/2-dehydro-3-deoxy-phosphogluconate aldolase [Lentzea sp. BCCO 10_0856]|uniref:Bifunctional 4-hydroxy-2-oxoglutarate aldolase/2-dehydro-3-deoxy-phosphogluconate aldolase n=1 Tax=Lentzea miocenica TaxID=3095431 RepID=A0ABU4SWB5_9PSEU|nr:bifunctional 4-hydroxy-2-oxoglutarate aldolase/2-dehydro-3-deoxy-phosphogluconate aldolase [Lentzea sp. BCCO 10_0856]MDX8030191.1 bifunctional 4-hydroxy-2-oxoglutarate aldolase/2-dehydro-3-deoxy-phosphogluconate aldolase [Lentzea sp. BCCO 10_0856]
MSYRYEITQAVVRQGIIAIVRTQDAGSAVKAAVPLLDAGLTSLELPLTNPQAPQAIQHLRETYPDATIGAGSVLDEASAVAAIRAGAQFLVAPNLDLSVIRAGHRYGAAVLPGAGTVSEIVQALEAGADAVKVFPAPTPQWVEDVLAVLPYAPLVPTGGVAPADVPAWLKAGAVACGVGSALSRTPLDEIRALLA